MRSCQELKDARETEDWMDLQASQGSLDTMVKMDILEKRGILDLRGVMRMQSQVGKGLVDHQDSQGNQDLQDLQAWDFQDSQEREAYQEIRDTQA